MKQFKVIQQEFQLSEIHHVSQDVKQTCQDLNSVTQDVSHETRLTLSRASLCEFIQEIQNSFFLIINVANQPLLVTPI